LYGASQTNRGGFRSCAVDDLQNHPGSGSTNQADAQYDSSLRPA
jgi:hypothetical protein